MFLCPLCVYEKITVEEKDYIIGESNFKIFEANFKCEITGENFPMHTKCDYFKDFREVWLNEKNGEE